MDTNNIEKLCFYICGLIDGEIIRSELKFDDLHNETVFKEFMTAQCENNYILLDAVFELGLTMAFKRWNEKND